MKHVIETIAVHVIADFVFTVNAARRSDQSKGIADTIVQ
jgi:hypothetical protein